MTASPSSDPFNAPREAARRWRELHATGRVSPRAQRALDQLHDLAYNFEVDAQEPRTVEHGWRLDAYCQPLPQEPPGPPVPNGPWETCRRLVEGYEFADPAIVRAVYYRDAPLAEREMLLEARFYGLRFHLGLRIGGTIDEEAAVDGRPIRRWGWNYRTLQGHLEAGQMDYEARKWLDTGEVEFRIDAFSKPAHIANPIVRLGFRIFGRWMQRRFARKALARMQRLVLRSLATPGGPTVAPEDQAVRQIDVRPAAEGGAAAERGLDRAS